MAITFVCPECEGDIKVKSELAGKKIKCPSCQEVVVVPREETRVAAKSSPKAAKKTTVPDENDEDEEQEEKPKKSKKKKKQQSRTGLYIGLGVGGAALAIGVTLALVFLLPGRNKDTQAANKKPPEEQKKPIDLDPPPVKVADPDPKAPPKKEVSVVGRQRDLIEYRGHFKNLGLVYLQFTTTMGKAPKSIDDLKDGIKGTPMLKDLEDRQVVFIYGVRPEQMSAGSSNTVLAYDYHADHSGQRLVLMGDGTVREMFEAEFKKAPKAK